MGIAYRMRVEESVCTIVMKEWARKREPEI